MGRRIRSLFMCCATALAALLLLCAPAAAHKPSDSYLSVTVDASGVRGQWDIALRDLEHAIGIDANDDGAITWDELRTRESAISAYALARLRLTSAGETCPLRSTGTLVDRHSDGAYVVLQLSGACSANITSLNAEYRLFFDIDPQHRGLTRITANGAAHTAIFSPEQPVQRFDMGGRSSLSQLFDFAKEGIWHIWIGMDHLLFLLALLLPSMFVRTEGGWQPVKHMRAALWNVFTIVTAFTVAHSITLSLAALHLVAAPSRWVETAIAASVLLAALNNLYPVVHRRLSLIAFVFGLIHGFGFASVLLDLGLPRDALILPLLGFNLGVEAGQLAVVALYFAVAYALRTTRAYARTVLQGGSGLVATIAVVWMLERGLDLKLLPF